MAHSSTRASLSRYAACLVAAAALAGGIAGCGGGADEERLRAEEIARAKADGRREAIAAQRSKDAAAEAKNLRKEIEKLKNGGSKGGSNAPAPSTPSAPSGGSSTCGDGVSVNSVTTCPFGRNVRDAYQQSGGASVIDVYSPVTKQTYTMRCSGGVTTVCSGGNNAAVYIR